MSLINVGDTQRFDYTGGIQTLTIEKNALYKLEVYGAKGGGSHTSAIGGNGGHSVGYKYLTKNTTLYIVCGGTGGSRTGGYNGGGTGGSYYATQGNGGGGGGASHISFVDGLLKDIGKDNFVANGLIVAGGGGGAGSNGRSSSGYAGGAGGGTSGSNGTKGNGGSQTSGYAFGQGGNGKNGGNYDYGDNGGGAGGGGFYGGYGATATGKNSDGSGGGGSGWIGGVPTITFGNNTYTSTTESGKNSGSGYAIITLIELPKEVKATSNPSGGGSFIGDGSFSKDTTTMLEAIPTGGFDFINWNLKGYTQLEYIESTGTQWINTNVVANENISYEFGVMFKDSSKSMFLGSNGNQVNSPMVIYNIVRFNGNKQYNGAVSLDTIHYYDVKYSSISIDGETKTFGTSTWTPSGVIYLFYRPYDSERFVGRLYNCKLYNNDILVRDYIPVIRHKDGAIGLLDLCELRFYGNSGSGEFLGGNIL